MKEVRSSCSACAVVGKFSRIPHYFVVNRISQSLHLTRTNSHREGASKIVEASRHSGRAPGVLGWPCDRREEFLEEVVRGGPK